MATGMLQAVGYRVVIKPIEAILTLEEAEAGVAPHLAEKGFQVKSEKERQREEHGENHGVIIHLGPTAFERLGGIPMWADVGETVVFSRYAGTAVEHPPGSGNKYQIMNDEDIFGKIV
jgi:co-chaperonin GroES (HSP10)